MFPIYLILAVTAATGAAHLEISPAQSTPGSTTTTISGEGTTFVVAALMKVIGDDLLIPELGRAFAAEAPLPTATIRYVSNTTTDRDLLHAYVLALKTGPAPGPADPPVPTIVGGPSRIVPTTICSRGRTPTNYVSELPLSVGNVHTACFSKQNRLANWNSLLRHTPLSKWQHARPSLNSVCNS